VATGGTTCVASPSPLEKLKQIKWCTLYTYRNEMYPLLSLRGNIGRFPSGGGRYWKREQEKVGKMRKNGKKRKQDNIKG
jgi:hypothetical protein